MVSVCWVFFLSLARCFEEEESPFSAFQEKLQNMLHGDEALPYASPRVVVVIPWLRPATNTESASIPHWDEEKDQKLWALASVYPPHAINCEL